MIYKVPEKFYFRTHHVRPRFKNMVEEVLIYVADAIVSIGAKEHDSFRKSINQQLINFPGNVTKSQKTIENWRTEISALFSLYKEEEELTVPSSVAKDLSDNQDLTKFFKYFLYTFQYPGGHVKPKEVKHIVDSDIKFHPASYILKVITAIGEISKSAAHLNKAEACHLIFNDLRVLTDHSQSNVEHVAKLVLENRKKKIEYDWNGDVVRYAGDILDYMVLANILKDFGGKFFINSAENNAIRVFLKRKSYFEYSDSDMETIKEEEPVWVNFCSDIVDKKLFETNLLAFIAKDAKELKELEKRTEHIKMAPVPDKDSATKHTGDYGESLTYGHECMTLKIGNREDLLHLVQCLPNHHAAGYDIRSIDVKENYKHIEVKSTVSNKTLTYNKFRLTPNELRAAQSYKDSYYVYRIQLTKDSGGSFLVTIINDPVKLFKNEQIDIDLQTGEVNLKSYKGTVEKLLEWKR